MTENTSVKIAGGSVEIEDKEMAQEFVYDEERNLLLYGFWIKTEETDTGWYSLPCPYDPYDICVVEV